MQSKYKRVLLKISGEALAGDAGFGLDQDTVFAVCEKVAEIKGLTADEVARITTANAERMFFGKRA